MASSDGAGRGATATVGAIDVEQLLGDRGRLLALARRLAGGDDDAEDLVQETWLRTWLHPPGDAARAGGWMRRIAENLAARRHVRAAARVARERSVAAREAQPATDALVAQVELQRALADALLALDEPHRRVVLLRFWEQLPPRAIAAQLGLPVETVRTRQKRALARLRERLDARYGSRDSWGITAWTAGAAAMGSATKAAVAAGIVVAFGLGVAGWQLNRTAGRVEETTPLEVAAPVIAAEAPAAGDAGDGGEAALPVAERTATDDAAASRFERVELRGSVVDAATQQPLAEARVVLHWYERSDDGDGTTFDRSVVITTAADGRFTAIAEHVALDFFDGVVTRSGHARLAFSSQANQPNGKPTLVDFGRLALAIGARIVGRVVTLPDRVPVANAELHLGERYWVSSGEFAPDSGRPVGVTRSDGRFALDERVVADPMAAVLYAIGAGRVGFALFRTTGGVEQVDVEIGLEAAGALDVTVVDPTGEPVADAEVTACPAFRPFGESHYGGGLPRQTRIFREPWKSLFHGTTDESGGVHFATLPEGREDPLIDNGVGDTQSYYLHVVAPGWPRAFASAVVQHGERRDVTVKLLPPTVHRIVGRVTDAGGAPIAGATIHFDQYDGFDATSDADGRYATADREGPIGSIDGTASASGHATGAHGATREWVRSRTTAVAADESGAVGLDGTPRAREEYLLDFVLARATTVSGRVVDEAGEPVAGVTVRAQGLMEGGSRFVTVEAKGGATAADGRFELEGVAGDRCTLHTEVPEGWLAPFPLRVRSGKSDVEIVVQHLPASTARAVVNVRDAVSGEAITPVRAYARPLSATVNVLSGGKISDGQVTVDALFPGDWDLRVETGDGRHARLPFRVETLDQQLALELAVGGAAIVDGQLTFEGRPLRPKAGERFMIWGRATTNMADDAGHALDADGRLVGGFHGSVARADAEGRFTMGQLLPGVAIRFWVDAKERRASTTFVLQPGERRSLEIELAPAAAIEWRMGESLPPGRIFLELARGDEPRCREEEFPVDEVGNNVARSRTPSGHYRWRATWTASLGIPPEQRVASGTVDLAAAATATVDIAGFR